MAFKKKKSSKLKSGKNKDSVEAKQLLAQATALHRAGNLVQAEQLYVRILQENPQNDEALHFLGLAAYQAGNLEKAVACIGKAIEINPNVAQYYNNISNALFLLGNKQGAIGFYKKALSLKPNYPEVINNLGAVLNDDGLYEDEMSLYESGLKYNPINGSILNNLVKAMKEACRFDKLEEYEKRLISLAGNNPCPISPYNSLTLPIDAKLQQDIALNYVKNNVAKYIAIRDQLGFAFADRRNNKIKIGYVSADFRNHPTAHLIKGLFDLHNRDEFEIYAYSTGPDDGSEYRKIIEEKADHFIDLTGLNDINAAQKIYADGIDILADVMGYIQNARPGIFALRPAPVQINYLAYPGTMGANFMDYIVLDKVALSEEQKPYISENIIYMQDTYFISDNKQKVAKQPSRAECGLPEDKFIFCSFNKANKINREVFKSWCNILDRCKDSVLWLLSDNEYVQNNLRAEAEKNNIAKERILFADRLPKDQHLGRFQNADIFLDCFAVNAHTTAIDSLFAGVPVITKKGDNIINRASESILNAIGLSELVMTNTKKYEDLAIKLAKDPKLLKELKDRLKNNIKTEALFDTGLYVKNLEKAYEGAWNLFVSGEKARSIDLSNLK